MEATRIYAARLALRTFAVQVPDATEIASRRRCLVRWDLSEWSEQRRTVVRTYFLCHGVSKEVNDSAKQ